MNFDQAFIYVIGSEGGYVNDPRDPGGETKYGISKRSYPHVDIAALTLAEAENIYRSDYWDACRCDELPNVLRLMLFDMAVNQGVKTAIKVLQKVLGVTVDGVIGVRTVSAANAATLDTFDRLAAERALRYVDTGGFGTYGRGWFNRLFRTYRNSL